MEMLMLYISIASLSCLSFLPFASSEENKGNEKPYTISKSSLCPVITRLAFCKGKYDFEEAVREQIAHTDLKEKHKVTGMDYGKCGNAFKEAICSEPSPLCIGGDATEDHDKGARIVCSKLRLSCPLMKSDDSFKNSERACVSYLKRKFIDLKCTNASIGHGAGCPRPERKMPSAYIGLYEKRSNEIAEIMKTLSTINKESGNKLFPDDCLKTIEKAVCVPIYCSDDEKTMTLPNAQARCNKAMKCVAKTFDHSESEILSFLEKPVRSFLASSCDAFVDTIKKIGKQQTKKAKKKAPNSANRISLSFVLLFVFLLTVLFY